MRPGSNPGPPTIVVQNGRFRAPSGADRSQPGPNFLGNYCDLSRRQTPRQQGYPGPCHDDQDPLRKTIVGIVIIAFLAGTLPALRASRKDAIAALRYE